MLEKNARWSILKESVRGVSHEKNGLPNQDSIFCVPQPLENGQSSPYIVSISDGHGNAKSFRSDKGSQIAVSSSVKILHDFIDESVGLSFSQIKKTFEEVVIKRIHHTWRARTDCDFDKNPFMEAELSKVREKYDEKAIESLLKNPRIAYGATLLLVAVTQDYIFFMQNGDGDILVVMEDGETIRPLPLDSRLIANETTSLSSEDAWKDFRTGFQMLSGRLPKLILLSSDGYSNSFVSDADFLLVGRDILAILQEEGIESVRKSLKGWLYEASKNGSGDDVTVGLLYRND